MQGNDCVYRSLNDKPFDSFYLYVEAMLDYDIQQVWPHALNIGGWMSSHRLQTIAGEVGHVGYFERVFPRNLGSDIPLPHYHLYGIAHIIEKKMIVLEVLPEKGGSYGSSRQKMSFDTILLTDFGGRTLVGFHMVDVHMGKGDEESRARRHEELEVGVTELLRKYFDNLRRLVERGSLETV